MTRPEQGAGTDGLEEETSRYELRGYVSAGKPLLTVIVPTRNRLQVRDAVASVVTQTHGDFECIVVDDASDKPITGDFGDKRVRTILRKSRGGPAAARNTGLERARGRFVVFLDDDDLFETNRLALGIQGAASSPLTVCAMKVISPTHPTRPWLRERVHLRSLPHLGQVTILRTLAPKFDERFRVAEDVDWWIRASTRSESSEVPVIGYIMRSRVRPRVRPREELEAELQSLLLLLASHEGYFRRNRAAAAWRWKRISRLWLRLGERARARLAMATAEGIEPSTVGRWDMMEVTVPIPKVVLPRL